MKIYLNVLLKKQAIKLVSVLSLFIISFNSLATGLLQPVDLSLQPLEIKEHHVNVVIEDGYAITSIEQVFFNANQIDLEAKYSFPVPNKASVGEFTYWIDGQPVTGEVVEKIKAQQIYSQEKQAGREVAITEKNDYINFLSTIYPVRAQQNVRIKLVYIQPAFIDMGVGRYLYPLEDGGTDKASTAFWTNNDVVTEKFSFKLLFRSSYPVEQFRLPKHPNAIITQISAQQWSVEINNDINNNLLQTDSQLNTQTGTENFKTTLQTNFTNTNAVQHLDQDIVVYWRHQANLPGRVELVTHKNEQTDQGTFMLTFTPGDDLAPITEGRDWVYILDYSGSMQGKYNSMVEGVNKGLEKLNTQDRFRIIIFSDSAKEITNGFVYATPTNVEFWSNQLIQQKPNGSTNLYDGIKLGIKSLDSDRSSALVLVSDGAANVGKTKKQDFLKLLQQKDVRLFTFVMGNSTNRPLLESMVKVSNGFAISVSNSDDIVGQLKQATSKLTHEAFHDINIKISGVRTDEITPEKIGSLYRGQQLIIMGHYWGDGIAKVELTGKVSGQAKNYQTEFNFPERNTTNPEIERLWAYNKIEDLENEMAYFGHNNDTEQAITDIAINYGLVTNYTSLIVMREEQFEKNNIDRNNKKRVEKENNAQAQRQTTAVKNNRVDTQQPMYQSPVPSHTGGGRSGGSFNFLMIFLLLPFLLIRKLKKQI
ncbi:MAG: GlyGly-CTERM sorting domain-containing protein [Saccharospirillaceae bacterium]|nr:VIT and VWA domain-containing protein [Pseudomonadales bacterium]NRB77483.1 GlyGly-CTERM sorting domain-containing protein [Saccharospirillaceae bacterium]